MDASERRLKIWELVLRGGFGTVVTLLVGVVAIWANARIAAVQQQMKNAELRQVRMINAAQISNAQKELEISIATKLWEDLTGEFFPENAEASDQEALEEQMFRLRLTALNFQDIAINLKPFFERLDKALSGAGKQELRSIAREVARRQAYRLTFEAGLDFGESVLNKDKPAEIPVPPDFPTTITLIDIEADRARIRVSPPFQRSITFWVSYFDMPLVDNLKIKAIDERLAILLLETRPQEQQATVRIVKFAPYMAADRFDLKREARANENPRIETAPPALPQ